MRDSFDPSTSVPTSIGPLELILTVLVGGAGNIYAGRYTFDVLDQNGLSIETRTGNVIPHMTNPQKLVATTLLDELQLKATGAVA